MHRSPSVEGGGILRILGELGRRHVYKVAGGYTIAAVGLITLVEYAVALMGLPQTVLTGVVLAAVAGFPACMILAWVFDIAPEGVVRTGPWDDTAAHSL